MVLIQICIEHVYAYTYTQTHKSVKLETPVTGIMRKATAKPCAKADQAPNADLGTATQILPTRNNLFFHWYSRRNNDISVEPTYNNANALTSASFRRTVETQLRNDKLFKLCRRTRVVHIVTQMDVK